MIILLLPLKFYRFGDHIFADFVVDVGFVGLAELVTTADAVHLAVFDKTRTRLMKTEGNIASHALRAHIENPIIISRTSIHTRFATYGNFLNFRR